MATCYQEDIILQKQVKLLSLLRVACKEIKTLEVYTLITYLHCHYLASFHYPLPAIDKWITNLVKTVLSVLKRNGGLEMNQSISSNEIDRCLDNLLTILAQPIVATNDRLRGGLLTISCLYTCLLLEHQRPLSLRASHFMPTVYTQWNLDKRHMMTPDLTHIAAVHDDLSHEIRCHIPVALFKECQSDSKHEVYSVGSLIAFVTGLVHLIDNKPSETWTCWTEIKDCQLEAYTHYIQGCFHWRSGDTEKALECLSVLVPSANQSKLAKTLKVYSTNLTASCFSKQGKVQSAIALCRDCIKLDPDYFWPLYNLACHYKKLGLVNAELEILNLLVTSLEGKKSTNSAQTTRWDNYTRVALSLFGYQSGGPPFIGSLYALASRYKQLKRFEEASTRFLDLLVLIREDQAPHSIYSTGYGSLALPSVDEIYLESAAALLSSSRFQEAVSVCDMLISNEHLFSSCYQDDKSTVQIQEDILGLKVASGHEIQRWSLLEKETAAEGIVHSDEGPSQKRLRSGVDGVDGICDDMHIQAVMCKAECLYHLKQIDKAIECLQGLFPDQVEPNPQKQNRSQQSQTRKRPKRERLAMEGSEAVCRELSSPFTMYAVLLQELGQPRDALHFSRLALQTSAHDERALFNHTIILFNLGRALDAVSAWLPHRGLHPNMDLFQLETLLSRKKKLLRETGGDEKVNLKAVLPSVEVSESDCLLLDLKVLNCLQAHKFNSTRKQGSLW